MTVMGIRAVGMHLVATAALLLHVMLHVNAGSGEGANCGYQKQGLPVFCGLQFCESTDDLIP